MYQTLLKDIEVSMQPWFNLAEIQSETLEKFINIRTEHLNKCMNASIAQYEALGKVSTPLEASELQMKFIEGFSAQVMGTVEKKVELFTEAGESMKKVIEDYTSKQMESLGDHFPMAEMFEPFTETLDMVSPFLASESIPATPVTKPVTKPVVKKAPVKKAATKKPAAKTATTKATSTTTTKKATAKTTVKKPAAKKAASTTTAAKTTAAKAPVKRTTRAKAPATAAPVKKASAKAAASVEPTTKPPMVTKEQAAAKATKPNSVAKEATPPA